MKLLLVYFGLFVFMMTSVSYGQSIKSNSSWPSLSADDSSKSSSDFSDLDEEIEDLEDLSDDQDIPVADFEAESSSDDLLLDNSSSTYKSSRSKKSFVRKSRKGTRPRKRIVRRVIRKKRPARRSRSKKTTTLVTKAETFKTPKQSNFQLTPIAGGSVSMIRGDLLKNTFANNIEEYTGFAFGVLTEYRPFGSFFGVETGAHYVQTGAEGDSDTAQANTNRLNYICNEYLYIPLNAKLYPIRLANFDLFLKAGVKFGWLLSSTVGGTTAQNFQYEVDGTSSFKGTDFAGNLGLGFKARVSRAVSLGFEAVYHRGFMDISNSFATNFSNFNANGAANLGNDAYNSGVMATLGIVIEI